MSRRVLYLDCAGGAAGDMVLCALTEAADCAPLIEELPGNLGFSDVTIDWPTGRSGGFAARRLTCRFRSRAPTRTTEIWPMSRPSSMTPSFRPPWRSWPRRSSGPSPRPRARSTATTAETVHFHEVGAVDAIVDVVGACLALDQLAVNEIVCSSPAHGFGHRRLRPRHHAPAGPGGGRHAAGSARPPGRSRGRDRDPDRGGSGHHLRAGASGPCPP